MTTIKSFTSLEQSRKLAEILPIESADMYWSRCTITDFGDKILKVSYAVEPCNISQFRNTKEDIPAWSLASLLGVLPEGTKLLKSTNISSVGDIKYHCDCLKINVDKWFDNPVDACVAMVEKLNELKML